MPKWRVLQPMPKDTYLDKLTKLRHQALICWGNDDETGEFEELIHLVNMTLELTEDIPFKARGKRDEQTSS